jgi:hypothetical protein
VRCKYAKEFAPKMSYIKNICKMISVIKTIFLTSFKVMSELETRSLITFLKLLSSSIQSCILNCSGFKAIWNFTSDRQEDKIHR